MKQISIREQDEFIKLGQALKKANLVSSGVEAKIVIQDGQVTVNGETETNIIYGDNAQGKTNILEAAYLSGTTKSHKGSKDKEMIRFGEDEAHIRTIVEKNDKEYRIDMHLRKNGAKGVAINKMPIKKASEYCVFLS